MIYHANLKLIEVEWDDFGIVDFDDQTSPARIHGFFKYITTGVLAKNSLQDHEIVELCEDMFL